MHSKKRDCLIFKSNCVKKLIFHFYCLKCWCNVNVLLKQTLNVDYKVTEEEWCQLL